MQFTWLINEFPFLSSSIVHKVIHVYMCVYGFHLSRYVLYIHYIRVFLSSSSYSLLQWRTFLPLVFFSPYVSKLSFSTSFGSYTATQWMYVHVTEEWKNSEMKGVFENNFSFIRFSFLTQSTHTASPLLSFPHRLRDSHWLHVYIRPCLCRVHFKILNRHKTAKVWCPCLPSNLNSSIHLQLSLEGDMRSMRPEPGGGGAFELSPAGVKLRPRGSSLIFVHPWLD